MSSSSAFPGSLPDFSSSIHPDPTTTINNNNASTIPQHHHPIMYRPPQFLPDRSLHNNKRTLTDFQTQHHQQQHYLRHLQQQPFSIRSVKPRLYNTNPPYPADLLPDIAAYNNYNDRYNNLMRNYNNNTGYAVNQNSIQNGVVLTGRPMDGSRDTAKKMIMNRLQELEKQLLDDDDDDDVVDVQNASGSVSVITGNEWTETIQNLINTDNKASPLQQQQQVNTPSPSSSTSSCSSTVLPICTKQLIAQAASAIADGKLESGIEIVTRVAQLANPRGTSEQRLSYYMSVALKAKLNCGENQIKLYAGIGSKEHSDLIQLLYKHSNLFKLGFYAANLAIIEATEDVKCLHLVDFDLGDGTQYKNFIPLIALRKSGKPVSIKITAVNVLETSVPADEGRLRNAFNELSQISSQSGITLEVKAIRLKRLADVSRESLCSNENEVLAVNMAHILSKLQDESVSTENQRDELLRRVKSLKPQIVTVVEQDRNCNTAPFQTRVSECYSFYSALLESLCSSMARDDPDRIRVEEGLGGVMLNALACEGGERVERCEVLGKWRARMGMAGFEMKPVSQNVVDSLSSWIVNNNVNSGRAGGAELFAKEVNGGVGFGWMGRMLTVTSTWR